MSELVTLHLHNLALPARCACCLGEPDDAVSPRARPLSVRVPTCRACARHRRRGAIRIALWIALAAAGLAALFFLGPPMARARPSTRALVPFSSMCVIAAAGAAAHLLVPRSRHASEGSALSVHASSPQAVTFRVHEGRYADLLVGSVPGSVRQPAGPDAMAILLGLPFGGIWAHLGWPVLSTIHASAVLAVTGALLWVAWPKLGDAAELEALRRAPSLARVQAFLADYPDSPLRDEVREIGWSCVSKCRDRFLLRTYLSIPGAYNRQEAEDQLAELDLADLDARPDWTRMARFAAEKPQHPRSAEFRSKLTASLMASEDSGTPPVELFRTILEGAKDGSVRATVSGFANNGEHLAGVRKFVDERLKVHGVTAQFVEYGEPADIVMVGEPSTVRYRAPGEVNATEGLRYTLAIEVKAESGRDWTVRIEGEVPQSISVRKGEEAEAGRRVQESAYQGLISKLWSGPLFVYPRTEAAK